MKQTAKEKKQKFDRRNTLRVDCHSLIRFKICKEETISKIMEGYTQNVSPSGLKCTITQKVPKGCTLWMQLDREILTLCEEIDKKAVILQHGILGKVVWAEKTPENSYDVGIQFITREEKA